MVRGSTTDRLRNRICTRTAHSIGINNTITTPGATITTIAATITIITAWAPNVF